jgi:hypothetical protein
MRLWGWHEGQGAAELSNRLPTSVVGRGGGYCRRVDMMLHPPRSKASLALTAVVVLLCSLSGTASTGRKVDVDFEVWHNVPFLQGHGPGYDALETPWRVRQRGGEPLLTTSTSPAARLPLYVADGGTDKETVHDHTWGSQYRPKAGTGRCASADGPRCLALHKEYQNLVTSGVRKNPGKGGGSLPAGKGHGSSAIVQLFREYRRAAAPLTSGAIRQLPEEFRQLGLSSSDGAGSRQLAAATPATTASEEETGFVRQLGASPPPNGQPGQLGQLSTPPVAKRNPPRPPPPPPPPPQKRPPPPPPPPPPRAKSNGGARFAWSSSNARARTALAQLNGRYSVVCAPPLPFPSSRSLPDHPAHSPPATSAGTKDILPN